MRNPNLLVYVVIDSSASLGVAVEEFEAGLLTLAAALQRDPVVADVVKLCVICFATEAKVLVPLTSPADFNVPQFAASGSTNYGSAFQLVRKVLNDDVSRLKGQGVAVYRPLVFFVTDGVPTDTDWRRSLDALKSPMFVFRPTVHVFGFGSADPLILGEIAAPTGQAFILPQTDAHADAIRSIVHVLTESLSSIASSSTARGEQVEVHVPAGWVGIDDTF